MKKDEMTEALEDEREKLVDALDGLTDEQMEEPGVVGEWSIKDLLSHLLAWEAEAIKLLWQLQQGEKPGGIFAGPIDVDQVNHTWYLEMHARPLERVLADFEAVRKQTHKRLAAFTEKDLSDLQRYAGLKGRALEQIIAENTFEHDAEHAAEILAWRQGKGY